VLVDLLTLLLINLRRFPSHVVVARPLLLEGDKRRESGEDKREFAEQLIHHWLEFALCSQAIRVSYDSARGARR